jgi:chloramphenicol 3-O phosphotransferase
MLLNGTPSAGKTTLARAVQAASPMPLFHRSLDDFLVGYLPHVLAQDDGTLFSRVMVGYLGSLAQLALAENDVVAEAVMIPERVPLYLKALSNVPVLLVGVRCSLEVAEARERLRTDRTPLELDVPWFETVHQIPYDLEVDTTDPGAIEDSASKLVALFADPPATSAFQALRRERT